MSFAENLIPKMIQQPQASTARKRRAPQKKSSLKRELRQRASQLGLPVARSVLPEGKLSPSYGDPTAVDERPFVRV